MAERKKALVTGGSRGIGSGIARVLAKNGYDIAITYSTASGEGETVKRELEEKYGALCFLYQATLQDEGVAEATVKRAIKDLGRLDLLVNNAGVTRMENLLDITDENFELLARLDFKAYVMAARTAARHMVKRGIKGSIISITSTRGGRAYESDGIYGGVKAALNRASESFALDLAPYGIRVNTVAPGATQVRFDAADEGRRRFYSSLSGRIPLGRVGTPEDIGEAVNFLADNEKAGYITGVTIKVDGGLVLPGMPENPDAPSWLPPKRERSWDDSDL
ncbi:3-ketoacyl-ACP reductase [Clostridia bacterium]|nr:3-ketoacyl-ACP reductase [Clostridia bacterium]